MTNTIYDDPEQVWEVLLFRRFGPTAFSISTKQAFLSFIKEESRRPGMDIRQLQHSPEQYQIIINVFQSNGGQAIISRVVKGETVPTFFQQGKIVLQDLNIPVDLDRDLFASVHVHRLADDKVICLYHAQDCDWMDGHLFFETGACLEMSDLLYTRRLDKELSRLGENIDGIMMQIVASVEYEETGANASCDCGFCFISGKEMLIKDLELNATISEYDDYNEFPQDSKVTFAHYLENMYGWNH